MQPTWDTNLFQKWQNIKEHFSGTKGNFKSLPGLLPTSQKARMLINKSRTQI